MMQGQQNQRLSENNAKKSKGGRPLIEIDPKLFEGLCKIQCTLFEMANVLRVSEDTVERFCKRQYGAGFAEIYKKFSAAGKISLRRSQFRLAEKSPAMAIWLGKQYLGQRDHLDVHVKDLRERAELAVQQAMERTGKSRYEAIEMLKPLIPQISELVH